MITNTFSALLKGVLVSAKTTPVGTYLYTPCKLYVFTHRSPPESLSYYKLTWMSMTVKQDVHENKPPGAG